MGAAQLPLIWGGSGFPANGVLPETHRSPKVCDLSTQLPQQAQAPFVQRLASEVYGAPSTTSTENTQAGSAPDALSVRMMPGARLALGPPLFIARERWIDQRTDWWRAMDRALGGVQSIARD